MLKHYTVSPVCKKMQKHFNGKEKFLFLLLCKIKACGFSTNAFTLIQSHTSNRHQIIKVGDKFSKWQKICSVVPQVSIPGPVVGLFFLLKLLHYANVNAMCPSEKNANIVINRLRHDFFDNIGMVL